MCNMNKINRMISKYNYTPGNSSRIKYIVIHYVGALGGAKENCIYYGGRDRGSSAHYFVGFDGEIWQCVEDQNIAWHCGASSYKHPECRNANSIGIEMCVRKRGTQTLGATDRDWYFENKTVQSTIELVRYLMEKYHIPADHVIRHYDVTGKICPNPYVYNEGKSTWDTFKKAISAKNADHETKKQVPEVWYRVRKTWKNAGSQVGAFKTLKQAKQCADQYAGYRVYKTSGKKVYVSLKLPYKVQVKTGTIPVRSGPAKTYRRVKQISKGVFEITEEKNGFGKLKSGAGWIYLKKVERV